MSKKSKTSEFKTLSNYATTMSLEDIREFVSSFGQPDAYKEVVDVGAIERERGMLDGTSTKQSYLKVATLGDDIQVGVQVGTDLTLLPLLGFVLYTIQIGVRAVGGTPASRQVAVKNSSVFWGRADKNRSSTWFGVRSVVMRDSKGPRVPMLNSIKGMKIIAQPFLDEFAQTDREKDLLLKYLYSKYLLETKSTYSEILEDMDSDKKDNKDNVVPLKKKDS